MSTKPPADPPMERGANPVRPATAPIPRKPAAPPPKSGFQRFVLQFLLLVIALGGAFGTGYLVNANEMQNNRNDLLQQQLDAQERILALEQQLAELQDRRESGNRVELDLTEVFEPIREAVGRIALVRMGEISKEITTELTRLVEDDVPALDEPTNATGTLSPGMNGGSAVTDQSPESEAAPAAAEAAPPPSDTAFDSLEPGGAALDAANLSDESEGGVALVGDEPEGEASPTPAASSSSPANGLPAASAGLPSPAVAAAEEASLSAAPIPPAGGSRIRNSEAPPQPEPIEVAELTEAPPPGGVPISEP